jgi:acyl dehydratase
MAEKTRKLADMKEGERFTPLEFELTPHVANCNVIAIDDRHPWYVTDSPFGGRIVPPVDTWFSSIRCSANHVYGSLKQPLLDNPAIIHYLYDAEYITPAKVGETIKVTGECTKKYRKRGRPFMDFSYLIQGADDRLIAKHRTTFCTDYRRSEDR